MAKNRFVRWVSVMWDKDAARRMQDEAEASLARTGKESSAEFEKAMQTGGAKGARALTASLQREYRLRMARLSASLADGTINERDFRREGEKAAREFNAGLTQGIQRLRTSTGGLSDAQFAGLGSRYKSTAAASAGMAAVLFRSPLFAPLAGVLTASEGLRQARNAIEAADELANSIQKLGGTAKITGLNLAQLESESARVQETFKLSVPIANDLTTEVAKLAAKAGDVSKTGVALAAFLDIGAARGLDAARTMQAVGQALLGIDEGTDKLFGKNPSAIYDEWARAIGRTGESLNDQEKAQALLDETMRAGEITRGAYSEWLKTTQGQAAQAAMEIRGLQAQIGETFGPTRILLLKIQLAVVGALASYLETSRGISAMAEGAGIWDAMRAQAAGSMGMGDVRALDRAAGLDVRTLPGGPTATPLTPEQIRAAADEAIRQERLRQQEIEKTTRLLKEQSEAMYAVMTGMAVPGAGDGSAGLNLGMRGEGRTPLEKLGEDMIRFGAIGEDVAASVSGAFQDMFSLMFEEGASFSTFIEGVWRGMAAAVGKAVSEIAAGEAAKSFAYALSMGAHALGFAGFGNLASAAAAAGSASQHVAAGLAWSALAGASAAGAGAARSRSPGSTYDQGLSTARSSIGDGVGPEVTIIFNGPNELSPEFERTVYGATERARERYGDNAKITVRRAS